MIGAVAGVVVRARRRPHGVAAHGRSRRRVAVHGVCGIWGTCSLGLFATGKFGAPAPTGADNSAASVVTGLFYGGGINLLVAQVIGSASITAATFVVSMAMMYAVKAPARFASRKRASSKVSTSTSTGHGLPELLGMGGGSASPASEVMGAVPRAASAAE